MPQGTRICKVCGKEYPYCKTLRDGNIFRWQDVACSPEHGSEYFAQVLAARKNDAFTVTPAQNESVDIPDEPVYYDEEDEEDEDFFDEDYEDDDE